MELVSIYDTTVTVTCLSICSNDGINFITARRSYASAVLGIVIMSVRPSVTRVLCDETKEHTADILIPHERVITLVF